MCELTHVVVINIADSDTQSFGYASIVVHYKIIKAS